MQCWYSAHGIGLRTSVARENQGTLSSTSNLTKVSESVHVESGLAQDRAFAAMIGLAIGDALGMPTQGLTREDVVKDFGPMIDTFHPARLSHPYASGLGAGTVTDDTEQTLVLAKLLLEDHDLFEARDYARRLLEWERSVRQRGLLDLLGPSTKQALVNIELGMDLEESGRSGTTNGAAMRITPVGIRWSARDLKQLVHHVVQVSAITHNTSCALSAAAAVAAVVSAGIEGGDVGGALECAVEAASLAQRFGEPTLGIDIPERIENAIEVGRAHHGLELIDAINKKVGTSLASHESIPAAFAILVAYGSDSFGACCAGASLGGDTDTIAAMVGAMSGACNGSGAFPRAAIELVESTNGLDLAEVAHDLLALRQ